MARWGISWGLRSVKALWCHGLAVLLFTSLSVALTWPVARSAATHLENDGDAVLNAWTLGWVVSHLLRPAELPHAPNFYPYPYTLYFSEHLLGAALLAAPVIGLTGNPVLAYNLLFISAFALSALSAYALVQWLTRDWAAALLSGLLFGSMTLRFSQSPQLQVLLNFGIPLAVLFLLRFLRSGNLRDLFGLAFAFAWQFLISLYHGLFLSIGLILISLEQVLRNPHARRLSIGLKAVLGFAVAALILVPAERPYLEAQRWVGSRALDQQAFFGLLSYLLVPRDHLYARLPPFWEVHRYHGETLFPGWVPLILAGYALWRSRSPWRRPFALLTLLGLILSIGPTLRLRLEDPPLLSGMPYIVLWRFLPGFQAIRVPHRIIVLTHLGLAVLAGLGLRTWRQRGLGRPWTLAMVFAWAALEAYRGPFPRHPAPQPIPALDQRLTSLATLQPFVEFPTVRTLNILSDPETMRRLSHVQFATLYRGQPTPIGYSGFFPPLFWEVADRLMFFPSRESLSFFEDLGVRAVIIRSDGWTSEERQAFETRWSLFQDFFRKEAETAEGSLYFLTGRPTHEAEPGGDRIAVLGVADGDGVWLFLSLPRAAWPWRISLTPGRYTLEIMEHDPGGSSKRSVFEGTLPLVLPDYLSVVPVGVLRPHHGARVLEATVRLEPGEGGRLQSPPRRPLIAREAIRLMDASQLPERMKMPEVTFQNGLTLSALILSGSAYCPGETLEFSLFWRVWDAERLHAQSRVPVIFIHLHDREGRIVGGRDLMVDIWNKGFRSWAQGEMIVQPYRLALPADLQPGPAFVVAGLYPLGQPADRWPIRSARAPLWEYEAAMVAAVEIQPTPCRVSGR